MKKYFAKYLPVEGKDTSQIWQWNNNVKNTGWELISCSDMDAIIAHGLNPTPEFRKVKLFLCSRDIQVGDKINSLTNHLDVFPTATKVTEKFVDYYLNGASCTPRGSAYKVIGEISPEASWVKKGDEFDDEDVQIKEIKFKHPFQSLNYTIYQIKGPCGHFH